MKIKIRELDGIMILDVSGEITIGEGDIELRKEINDLIGKGHKSIILNLSKVSFIDSSGIGEIVRGFTTVQKHGGKLILLGLQAKVRDLFIITRLITVFESFDNEKKAIESFK
jgi:anti-sigma B factor antagonist